MLAWGGVASEDFDGVCGVMLGVTGVDGVDACISVLVGKGKERIGWGRGRGVEEGVHSIDE